MKTLEKDELYRHVHGFLKSKGVQLQPGSYSQKIQQSCGLLSDAINVSQRGLTRAKTEIDRKLDQLRQVIHDKTAPPRPSAPRTGPEEPKARKRNPTNPRRKARKSKKSSS